MISVQCNSKEMLVSINFDAPFRGKVMAKGNPEQCYIVGDGQASLQFPIVFGPKCNSRQEGHNTFVNEVVIQQHPIIMTDNDKTVRVMCAFEAPEQTITLKNPSSRYNASGIDVGAPEASRTRHDKSQFNSVVSNKAEPPSVVLRILDAAGRDASMINLGDDLTLKIQMQMDGSNSALGIFARNLAARSSNGETLLLIDNDGCPVDNAVFPGLQIDQHDGISLYSTFKAFRFPSSGLVNFEVQIRFCPERCQPVDCRNGSQKTKSFGKRRRKRQADSYASPDEPNSSEFDPPMSRAQTNRTAILESVNPSFDQERPLHSIRPNPIEALSTVMKPGKAFQYIRTLLLSTTEPPTTTTSGELPSEPYDESQSEKPTEQPDVNRSLTSNDSSSSVAVQEGPHFGQSEQVEPERSQQVPTIKEFATTINDAMPSIITMQPQQPIRFLAPNVFQKSILMHVDERVVPSNTNYLANSNNAPHIHTQAPYGRLPLPSLDELNQKPQSVSFLPPTNIVMDSSDAMQKPVAYTTTTISPVSELPTTRVSAIEETSNAPIENTLSVDATSTVSQPSKPPELLNAKEVDMSVSQLDNLRHPAHAPEKEPKSSQASEEDNKDVPLRFSIIVGENQGASGDWYPKNKPTTVMNSSKADMDHIVVPGKDGQLDQPGTSNLEYENKMPTLNRPINSLDQNLLNQLAAASATSGDNLRSNSLYEQTFDALPSNPVTSEIKLSQIYPSNHNMDAGNNRQNTAKSQSVQSQHAASHDCQIEAGNSRLKTIIWTGTCVIVLNVTLVVLSLILYFRRVHSSKNHTIVRAAPDSGRPGRFRWPSVMLTSNNHLGTSINTHEQFFCKLNAKHKPTIGSGNVAADVQWPNLSTGSSQSTMSSVASPLVTGIKHFDRSRRLPGPFDTQSSLRSNFKTNPSEGVHDPTLYALRHDREINQHHRVGNAIYTRPSREDSHTSGYGL